jgi:ribosome biogenesis GTPase
MREFALSGDADDDIGGFDDVVELGSSCRFRDCKHGGEPGCAVRAAVERGELSSERLSSYQKLSGELDQQKAIKRKVETRGASKRDGRGPLRGTGARKRAR